MRKHFLLLVFMLAVSLTATAQSRGTKIGYIDMEYILQNVPDYIEAKNQLEQKAQKWKQEVEIKQIDIAKLKESLKTERVLLTRELIEEREEEIAFQENALLEYQQKRFGPTGDLMTQKAVLAQPVQDQVFTAVQDIAEAKKYDFVFNKTSDLTMLFSAKRYDISDQVIRVLNRASRRNQLKGKELKEQEKKEALEDMVDDNPALQERQAKIDAKKAAREKLVADRKAAQEEKKRLAEEKRNAAKQGKTATSTTPPNKEEGKASTTSTTEKANSEVQDDQNDTDSTAATEDPKKKSAEARAQILADRKKAQEEKKAKALADRQAKIEAAKKAREDKAKEKENKN
ncbi:MAG TPA: OmpH family outer membrane protein [Flavobacterium sp.]|nr:OmpH family outer membrane protein [Flavobacterium sp.]HPJ09789.1 OmpH family outer membrane protein [Flavobacterium sp.]